MDICCERCQTEYELDESKITEAGVSLKCTNCGYIFRVRKKPMASGLQAEAEKKWFLRDPTGTLFQFQDLAVLQGWIREKKVTRDYEISRTGESWKRLGDIPEFDSLFHTGRPEDGAVAAQIAHAPTIPLGVVQAPLPSAQTVPMAQVAVVGGIQEGVASQTARYGTGEKKALHEAAALITASTMPGNLHPEVSRETPPGPDGASQDTLGFPLAAAQARPTGPVAVGNVPQAEEPAFVAAPPSVPLEFSAPAWELSDSRQALPTSEEEETAWALAPKKRNVRTVAVVIGGILTIVLALFAGKYWPVLRGSFSKGTQRGEEAYRLGRELYLLDTDESFERARTYFNQADAANEESSLGVASLAEMQATQALYLLDDVKLQERLGIIDTNTKEAAKRKAYALLEEAQRNAIEASRRPGATEVPEVQRAWATLRVVLGNPAQAVEADLAKVRSVRPDDAEAFFVEGALRLRDGQIEEARRLLIRAIELSKAKTQKALLRAQYLLARLEFDAGRSADAAQLLKEMLLINDKHVRARRLLDLCSRAEQGREVVASEGGRGEVSQGGEKQERASDRREGNERGGLGDRAQQALAQGGPAGRPGGVAPRDTPASKGAGAPLEVGGGSYEMLVSRAEKLQRTGATAMAQRLFEKALEQRPQGIEAMTGLAYCYLDMNRFQAAISMFQRVLAQDPRYGEAIIGLAEAYKLIGDKARALEQYRRYIDVGGPRRGEAERNIRELESQGMRGASPEQKQPLEPVTPPVVKEKTEDTTRVPGESGQTGKEKPEPKAQEEKPTE